MKSPSISIDRQAKSYAIFDGFNCIGGFRKYTDEKQAEQSAREEIAKLTDIEPEIIYPSITRITTRK